MVEGKEEADEEEKRRALLLEKERVSWSGFALAGLWLASGLRW
jgi:hypothetical protein